MKTKNELLKRLLTILSELEYGVTNARLKATLEIKLGMLYDILGEDVPSEYWDRIEECL